MSDDQEIRFPASLNQILRIAPVEKFSNIELICNGSGLHWLDLDEDLSIRGIIEGRYGEA